MAIPNASIRPLLVKCALVTCSAVGLVPAMAQQTLDRVEITGSSIRRIDGESALPVQVIKREAIARSGYTSTPDLLKNLPALMGSSVESGSVGTESFGFAGASIHNIGETRTLVLLNGRRLASFGGQSLTGANNAIDLNSIPISAIERIELLTDGASALYGSDAIAGVINFITRRGGTEGTATVGVSFPRGGARETNVSMTQGLGDIDTDGYSLVLSASADRRTQLAARERSFARSGEFFFNEGGQRYRFQTSSSRSIPANVYDQNYNRFNPYLLANGKCPARHFVVSNADEQACAYDFASDLEIYPDRQRQALTLAFDRRLANDAKLFGDLVYSRSVSRSTISYNPSEVVIAPSSPYYAQAVAAGGYDDSSLGGVLASYRFTDLGLRTNEDRAEALHLVLGLGGKLSSWDYNLAYTHSQSIARSNLTDGYGYNKRVLGAVNSVVNPFALPGQQDAAARAAIADARYTGYWNGGKSVLDGIEARGSTELMPLADGPLQLGTGVSLLREQYIYQPSNLAQGLGDSRFGDDAAEVPFDGQRHIYGAFVELVAPVATNVELTAALRRDHYSDFGGTTNAKLSGRWQPASGLLVRGSLGTGFKAPSLFQVKAGRQKYGVTGGSINCTQADGQGRTLNDVAASLGATCPDGLQADVIASGNKNLQAERSTQATLGLRIEPSSSLSFGADVWAVGIRNAIGQIDQNEILINPSKYAGSFTTNVSASTGQTLLAVYQPNVNQGKELRTGIDFDVAARTRVAGLDLTSQLNATWMLRDDYQTMREGAYASSLGQLGDNGQVTFRWQARWVNTLAAGAWVHTLALNYKSGYRDFDVAASGLADVNIVNPDGSIGALVDSLQRRVSDYISVDWQTSWRLTRSLTINMGVLNLFDRDPPRSITVAGSNQGQQTGYDDRYYDPRGRTVYVNLAHGF